MRILWRLGAFLLPFCDYLKMSQVALEYSSYIVVWYVVQYLGKYCLGVPQIFETPGDTLYRYFDICIRYYYYINRWYISYRGDRQILYLSQRQYDFVLFLCWVVWEVPGIYSRYLVGIYSIRYTCMKAYTKRIMIKFILQMNFFVRQASSFRIRSQIVTMSRISDFIIFSIIICILV